MRNLLFKFLFPHRAKQIEVLRLLTASSEEKATRERLRADSLGEELKAKEKTTLQDVVAYCTDTLGIPFMSFYDVDDDGKPPHYLAGLSDAERKDFIAKMESIYTDDKFQIVVAYVINVIGNFAMQKAEDDQMKNGKIGIIGIRTLMSEFIEAHQEHVDSKKPVEGFDPLAMMPE